ncbi:MAG: TatD DNase family protein [Chloroflexota bacterium]|nr:TatD DNase family protein [Chloroflexota bacterium]
MLVDTHSHVNAPEFVDDLPAVLDRAMDAGVMRIVCVGYDVPTSRRAVALAERDSRVYATVGVHPNDVAAAPPDWQSAIESLASHPRVVAVGETGLDYHWRDTPPGVQQAALEWHLALADAVGLPVVIHNRESDDDVTAALVPWARRRRSADPPGILHSFCGSVSMRAACLEAGLVISFSGMVTFPNKSLAHVAAAAREVPDDALLVETDAPYLAPVPHRGRRNEPAFVRATAARVAELRGTSIDHIEETTTVNALRVFTRMGPTP